ASAHTPSFPTRRPSDLYTSSTDRHGQPGRQKVLRRVHVPVMDRATAVARPRTDAERHPPTQGAAVGAQPGGGEEAIDRDHFPPRSEEHTSELQSRENLV